MTFTPVFKNAIFQNLKIFDFPNTLIFQTAIVLELHLSLRYISDELDASLLGPSAKTKA